LLADTKASLILVGHRPFREELGQIDPLDELLGNVATKERTESYFFVFEGDVDMYPKDVRIEDDNDDDYEDNEPVKYNWDDVSDETDDF